MRSKFLSEWNACSEHNVNHCFDCNPPTSTTDLQEVSCES